MQIGAQLSRATTSGHLDPDAVAEVDLPSTPERKVVLALDWAVRGAAANRLNIVRATLAVADTLKVRVTLSIRRQVDRLADAADVNAAHSSTRRLLLAAGASKELLACTDVARVVVYGHRTSRLEALTVQR